MEDEYPMYHEICGGSTRFIKKSQPNFHNYLWLFATTNWFCLRLHLIIILFHTYIAILYSILIHTEYPMICRTDVLPYLQYCFTTIHEDFVNVGDCDLNLY